jgi:hypothetical protein
MAATFHDAQAGHDARAGHDAQAGAQDLRAHRQTFQLFSKVVLFAVLHIALVLACLALAFLGNVPLPALILGLGGTIALIVAFTVV